MPLPDEKTITFNLWPNVLMVEGPAKLIATLILTLYEDPRVPKDAWNVAHTEKSRKTYAESLKHSDVTKMRKGIGIGPDHLVPIVEGRARSLGLTSFRMEKRAH
jgi:hypothetical protein